MSYRGSDDYPTSEDQGASRNYSGYDTGRSREAPIDPEGGYHRQNSRYHYTPSRNSQIRPGGREDSARAHQRIEHRQKFSPSQLREEATGCSGDRFAASNGFDHYHRSRESDDIPSLVESASSFENDSWSDDDEWDKKLLATTARCPSGGERLLEKTPGVKSIEISPGTYLRLRGAEETWKAIELDFYMPCSCCCCDLTLFCIQDADFVLCPGCRVVSPMVGNCFGGGDEGGVGLGFTMESLAKWQEEIGRNRRGARGRRYSC